MHNIDRNFFSIYITDCKYELRDCNFLSAPDALTL